MVTRPGEHTVTVTGLTPESSFFVRAYVTNSLETFYGNQVEFTTTAQLPPPEWVTETNIALCRHILSTQVAFIKGLQLTNGAIPMYQHNGVSGTVHVNPYVG